MLLPLLAGSSGETAGPACSPHVTEKTTGSAGLSSSLFGVASPFVLIDLRNLPDRVTFLLEQDFPNAQLLLPVDRVDPSWTDFWLLLGSPPKPDEFTRILDSTRAGKIVVPFSLLSGFVDVLSAYGPRGRVGIWASWSTDNEKATLFARFVELATVVSGIVLIPDTCETTAGVCQLADDIARALSNSNDRLSLPSLVYAVPSDEKPSSSLVATFERQNGIHVALPATKITLADRDNPDCAAVSVSSALAACLTSDRPDKLFTTLVVDEHGVALGLAYSSRESLAEAIATGTGVYHSRKRGIWRKGMTSGAIQRLRKIDVDCDRDVLRFIVNQSEPGFCHLNVHTCFGPDKGFPALERTLRRRKSSAPDGSYTNRLFNDGKLLRSKLMEEAFELCDARDREHVIREAADLLYFTLVRCVNVGVSLADIERELDMRAKKVSRRPGDAKARWIDALAVKEASKEKPGGEVTLPTEIPQAVKEKRCPDRISMQSVSFEGLIGEKRAALLRRPIQKAEEVMSMVKPIILAVRNRGNSALIELTAKFDRVKVTSPVIRAPFQLPDLDQRVKKSIDLAFENVYRFHKAQLDADRPLFVETQPGVVCSRFSRPIARVGLYVPGGTAVLPSTAIMLGVPAMVAGCGEIVIASPPRSDGSAVPEIVYIAAKVGASAIVLAGGAQAVAAMAYGTETVPKVDKIFGPGNQYVTAAKMIVQNDPSCLVSIDMPAGPSELLVICDAKSNPSYVAADLLSQAEHGPDSQVVLLAAGCPADHLDAIATELDRQARVLPRREIVERSIARSFRLELPSLEEAIRFSNEYAPEHLILHIHNAEDALEMVQNAGSVFVGPWSPESCGDYASGTNHVLPTYGYARIYSGVNTASFQKHISAQKVTRNGLDVIGDAVMVLAEVEGLEGHRNAVALRLRDIRES